MKTRSQTETSGYQTAFVDALELIELAQCHPNLSNHLMTKQILRTSNSTFVNLIEMVCIKKELLDVSECETLDEKR